MPKDSKIYRYRRRGGRPYSARKKRRWTPSKTNALAVNARVAVPRGIFGLPEQLKTHLRYVDVYTLTSTSNSVARQWMRLNSIFDPDYTGTGHQPLYLDQLSVIYKRYVVLGSKMKVTFSTLPNLTSTTQPSGPVVVGVVADDDAATQSAASTIMESNSCKSTMLCNQNGGNNLKILYVTYSPERDLGLGADDDTVGSLVSGNPSKSWYAAAWIAESGLSTATSVNVKIEIDYFVRFSQQTDVPQS